ncbi:ComF family protein [Microbulbifer hainanensis]|uniref:ComF family protein n=1 Tax=Microbulbifer hainanensis TaxID=2735675 RepID=UPI001866A3C5|nr:ComF family protein [Microbulbifer hainanensis]
MVYRHFSRFLSRHLTRCLLCSAACPHPSGICGPCQADLPALHHACDLCALPLPDGASRCPHCLRRPPAFTRARAAWHYSFPVGQLIHNFKYRGDRVAGRALARLAAERLMPVAEPPDLLVPIPLHWRRYWHRGFNQAQLIAAVFGHQWQIPVMPRLLRKRTATNTQQQLNRGRRLGNLRESFIASKKVRGLRIGLIDDVITTGATLEAAAQELLNSGAVEVSAFALCRVS